MTRFRPRRVNKLATAVMQLRLTAACETCDLDTQMTTLHIKEI